MTMRRPSILAELAHRAANHPSIEAAVTGAVRATLPGVIESILQEICPGETLRLYVPKTQSANRLQREQRIEAALSAGEAPDSLAKRENVSKRHLRRIRARLLTMP